MSSAVQFDSQPCGGTIEIQDVIVEWDAGGETYSLQNFGSVNVVKEYVQAQSPSFAAVERDPQRVILTVNASSEKHFRIPSPQSSPRKRGEADTSIYF
jgi:hypothetical protein